MSGGPTPEGIYIGIEAKHREFCKALLKKLLGARREKCYQSSGNRFAWWHRDVLCLQGSVSIVRRCRVDKRWMSARDESCNLRRCFGTAEMSPISAIRSLCE